MIKFRLENLVSWHVDIQSLVFPWKLNFLQKLSAQKSIANIELLPVVSIEHFSYEQITSSSEGEGKERERRNVDSSWFSELRGQIWYWVEARGFFYLQLLFTIGSLILLCSYCHFFLPFSHTHKILFIYPTELAVMQETITIYHTSMINTITGEDEKNAKSERAKLLG